MARSAENADGCLIIDWYSTERPCPPQVFIDHLLQEHAHVWVPAPPTVNQHGRYVCSVVGCGATGFKRGVNWPIQAHKKPPKDGSEHTHVSFEAYHRGTARKGKRGPGGW